MKLKTLLSALLICFTISVFGQNKILLTNGKVIEAVNYNVGDIFVTYTKTGDKKTGSRAVDRFDVFSITNANGVEEIVYTPVDSLDFTVPEAREFIKGEQAAKEVFKPKGTNIGAIVVGASASILSFYALPVPMLYSVVTGRFSPRNIKVPEGYDPALKDSEPYKLGYQKSARNMKIQKSLKWGYISLGAGLAGLIIYGATN
ncbi:MAG TPA: hypothetical protein PLJ43_09565 [Chitinophagales bacterium]|nr:hypothetical protein [Chitinophagales bacterium]